MFVNEKSSFQFSKLHINYQALGDGGVQGFLSTEFFIDQFGIIANTFLIFSSKSLSLVNDISARPILMDSKLIRLVYPLYN